MLKTNLKFEMLLKDSSESFYMRKSPTEIYQCGGDFFFLSEEEKWENHKGLKRDRYKIQKSYFHHSSAYLSIDMETKISVVILFIYLLGEFHPSTCDIR